MTEVNGVGVSTTHNLKAIFNTLKVGETIDCTFLRGQKVLKQKFTVGAKDWRLENVVNTMKADDARKVTVDGVAENLGSLTCAVGWESPNVVADIKTGTIVDAKGAKSFVIKMSILDDDKKQFKPLKSKKVTAGEGGCAWNQALQIKAPSFKSVAGKTLAIEVHVPSFWSSRLVSGLYIDLDSIKEDGQKLAVSEYTLSADPKNKVPAIAASALEHKKQVAELQQATPAVDIQFFNQDGICIQDVDNVSPFGVANLQAGDVIVGVLPKDADFEKHEQGGKFLGQVLQSVSEFQTVLDSYQQDLDPTDPSARVEIQVVYYRPILQHGVQTEVKVTMLTINDQTIQEKLNGGEGE